MIRRIYNKFLKRWKKFVSDHIIMKAPDEWDI